MQADESSQGRAGVSLSSFVGANPKDIDSKHLSEGKVKEIMKKNAARQDKIPKKNLKK